MNLECDLTVSVGADMATACCVAKVQVVSQVPRKVDVSS